MTNRHSPLELTIWHSSLSFSFQTHPLSQLESFLFFSLIAVKTNLTFRTKGTFLLFFFTYSNDRILSYFPFVSTCFLKLTISFIFASSQRQREWHSSKEGCCTGMEKKEKKRNKIIWEGISRILYEPSMARPCMGGYLHMGSPASNEERRLVTKRRLNVHFTRLRGASFSFLFSFPSLL